MRRFYKQALWILQHFLLTYPDLHHGLLVSCPINNYHKAQGWVKLRPWSLDAPNPLSS